MGSHSMHLELIFRLKFYRVIRTAEFKAKEWPIVAIIWWSQEFLVSTSALTSVYLVEASRLLG